jgi:hypothetical protein
MCNYKSDVRWQPWQGTFFDHKFQAAASRIGPPQDGFPDSHIEENK